MPHLKMFCKCFSVNHMSVIRTKCRQMLQNICKPFLLKIGGGYM